jgi:hypothetical protein
MTVDCQWIEKNLETLFSGNLNDEESRLARAHIASCASCRKEVEALNALDPLIKNYFLGQLAVARRPRVIDTRRVVGFSGAALAVVAILLIVVIMPQTNPVTPIASTPTQIAPAVSVEPPAPVKEDAAGGVARAKPATEPDKAIERKPETPAAVAANAPDFLVTDPAGYSRTLDDYRGHVVVLGMWSDESGPAANLERLYKAYGANPKFRFLGVSNERPAKPANTTFPVVYNQGSKVFGIQPGEFVLLNESGSIELRGSLVKDFEEISRQLRQFRE